MRRILFIFLFLFFAIHGWGKILVLQNKYLAIYGDSEKGFFYIKTKEGSPSYKSDNNKEILYHKDQFTTFGVIKIDDFDYKFSSTAGKLITPLYISGNKMKITLKFENVLVNRELSLINNEDLPVKNMIEVKYRFYNIDKIPHKIKFALLFDTTIGDKDGIAFKIPGYGTLSNEKSFFKIPPYWFLSDNIKKPSAKIISIFDIYKTLLPYKITFANWDRLKNNLWNYKPDINNDFRKNIFTKPDSAVAMYWDLGKMNKDSEKIIKFYYGIYEDKLYSNKFLTVSIGGKKITYGKPTFISMDIENSYKTNVSNIKINLIKNQGIKVKNSEKSITLLKKRERKTLFWEITPTKQVKGKIPFIFTISGKSIDKNFKDFNLPYYIIYTNINLVSTTKITQTNKSKNKIIKKTNSLIVSKKTNKNLLYKWKIINILSTNKTTNYITLTKKLYPNIVITSNLILIKWEKNERSGTPPISHYKLVSNKEFQIVTGRYFVYYIKKGDTLSEIIAKILHLKGWNKLLPYINAIVKFNKLKNKNWIYEKHYIYFPYIQIKKSKSKKEIAKLLFNNEKRYKDIIIYKSSGKNQKVTPEDIIIIRDTKFLESGEIKNLK